LDGEVAKYCFIFTEVVNILYDFNFEEYINYLIVVDYRHKELIVAMVDIDESLKEYVKIEMSDAKVLRDPNWENITLKAKKIISLWIFLMDSK